MEIAFPTVQIKYCRMIFCMSKHPSNNDQTDNVLKRETGSTFCFSSSCMDYFWIQNIQVTCWLSIKCVLASSCCCGDGFYPLNAESTDKEKKYMRRTKKAGEFHFFFFLHSNSYNVEKCNASDQDIMSVRQLVCICRVWSLSQKYFLVLFLPMNNS